MEAHAYERTAESSGQVFRAVGRTLEMEGFPAGEDLPKTMPVGDGCARVPYIGLVGNAESGGIDSH